MLVRAGAETAMFEHYERLCRQFAADASRRRRNIDPNDPFGRFVVTTDGGPTQLAATLTKESLDSKARRNEDFAKLSKNRTTVFQPADQGKGNGHMGQRQQTRKLSK